jgi:hypothetical protein
LEFGEELAWCDFRAGDEPVQLTAVWSFFSWATFAKTSDAGELVGGALHIAQTQRLTVGQIQAWVEDMVR